MVKSFKCIFKDTLPPNHIADLLFDFHYSLIYIQFWYFAIQYIVLYIFLYQFLISKYLPNLSIYLDPSVLSLLIIV